MDQFMVQISNPFEGVAIERGRGLGSHWDGRVDRSTLLVGDHGTVAFPSHTACHDPKPSQKCPSETKFTN
jgi:hypothetical protein